MTDEEILELIKELLICADYDLYKEAFEYEEDPLEEPFKEELIEIVRKHEYKFNRKR